MKSSNKSPDWYGTGWYKISENIGSKIAENPPPVKHCGTAAPAWIQYGGYPTKLGETNESVRVCFVWGGSSSPERQPLAQWLVEAVLQRRLSQCRTS